MSSRSSVRCLSLFPAALLTAFASGAHAANQVVSNCSNDTELRTDLATMQNTDGGTLTFSCAASTIFLTQDLPAISKNTTIDGGADVVVSGGNDRRIFVVNAGVTLTLRNIELTSGFGNGDGGAIYSNGGLVLDDVFIRESAATLSGGALVSYGPVLIEDSELADNKAENGGAVYARFPGAPVTIRGGHIRDNEATGTLGWGGAVLLWDGATLTVEDGLFTGNRAKHGGAIHNPFANSSVSLDNTTVHGNFATSGNGGGISAAGGPLVISDSSLLLNSATGNGGAVYYADGGTLLISESAVHTNDASTNGGGVAVQNVTNAAFVNVTISGNGANAGGGLYLSESITFLSHATITNNESVNPGDGFRHFSNGVRTTRVQNTVLQNPNGDNCASSGPGHVVSENGNVSSDISCEGIFTKSHDRNSTDPKLGPFTFNGGPTASHLPLPGSPVVDAGVATIVNADQRRVPRPQGAAADSGAIEVASCPPGSDLCGDANRNDSLSASDALHILRAAVGSTNDCPLYLCDFNGDEAVTATDSLAVLRESVGAQTAPPACPAKWDCHSLP
jgi:hypothetical protein